MVAAQGSDPEVEQYNLIAWMLSGQEAWQQYSKMLRKREERKKSQNKSTTRSNASRFRADSENEEVYFSPCEWDLYCQKAKAREGLFPPRKKNSVGYGVPWKWSINKIQCSMTHSQIPRRRVSPITQGLKTKSKGGLL